MYNVKFLCRRVSWPQIFGGGVGSENCENFAAVSIRKANRLLSRRIWNDFAGKITRY